MNAPHAVPWWIEAVVAVLLLSSALFAVVAALGLVRLKRFFERMHPPALVSTWSAWCVTLASILYFSALERRPALHVWLIVVLLAITVPVSTMLLSRAALFRARQAKDPAVPPALLPRRASAPTDGTPDDVPDDAS